MRSRFLMCLLACVLVGCQTLDSSQPVDWLMKGRVIIRTAEQAQRLSITWRQYQDESEILFTGPLGASVAKISPQNNQYVLERPGNPDQTADSLELLLEMVTGSRIPMSALMPVLQGEVAVAKQGVWSIRTTSTGPDGRPEKLSIQAPQVRINLTITGWS